MKFLFIVSGFLLLGLHASAQNSDCAQTLRLARSTYEQGRLHEIPALLKNCLSAGGNSGFTPQERIEALRILTLSYIYQEEPELADNTMLQLLNTDHFYEINESIEPAEFTALYKTFRTWPLFSVGIKFGANFTFPQTQKNYFVGSNAQGQGKYSPAVNIQYGVVFEKLLFVDQNHKSNWTAAPELLFTNHSFSYTNTSVTINDKTGEPNSTQAAKFSQSRIDLNLLVQYRLTESIINPYISFGPDISLLSNSSAQIETQFPLVGSVVTGPSIDMKSTFNKLDYALIASAGVKYKFGAIYLTADVRYKYGLTNITKPSARSNPEALYDYGFVSNNFKQSSLMINIGFIYPYFNPLKLLRKQ